MPKSYQETFGGKSWHVTLSDQSTYYYLLTPPFADNAEFSGLKDDKLNKLGSFHPQHSTLSTAHLTGLLDMPSANMMMLPSYTCPPAFAYRTK